MLGLAAAAAAGFLAARLVWFAVRPWLAQPAFARPNYRGRTVPTGAGLVLPLALFAVEGARTLVGATGAGHDSGITAARVLTVLAVAGFCILGAIDDVAGSGEYRGFRGHVLALAAGRVTTGAFKLLGGAAVALVVVAPASRPDAPDGVAGVVRLVADAALVALSANLGNLLDRRPGRVIKAGLAAFALLALLAVLAGAGGSTSSLSGVAVVVGAAAGLLLDDLREHLMLGDAGANPLGAALGLGVVLVARPVWRDVALAGVAALNLLGEVVSFTRVIDAVPPLRALDRLGRPSDDRPNGRSSR